MRVVFFFTKLIVLFISLVYVWSSSAEDDEERLDTQVLFIPGDYDGTVSRDYVQHIADYKPICGESQGQVKLNGLDLVRKFSGVMFCPDQDSSVVHFPTMPEIIILIDDTNGLSSYLEQQLSYLGLVQKIDDKTVVLSQMRSLNKDKANLMEIISKQKINIGRVLVLGEADYKKIGSEESEWYDYISNEIQQKNCDLSENDKEIVKNYSKEIYETNQYHVNMLMAALENFEETMGFTGETMTSSGQEILTKYFVEGSAQLVADEIVSTAKESGPILETLGLLYDFAKSSQALVDSVKKSNRKLAMNKWIKETRRRISNCLGNSDCRGDINGDKNIVNKSIQWEEYYISQVCMLSDDMERTVIEQMEGFTSKFGKGLLPNVLVYEKLLIESWVNSHYIGDLQEESIPGTINIFADVKINSVGEPAIYHRTAYVDTPGYGGNADFIISELIKGMSSVQSIWDFKIKKTICFKPDNSTKKCGLLDEYNDVYRDFPTSYYDLNMFLREYKNLVKNAQPNRN